MILRLGSKSDDVRTLQTSLRAFGFYQGAVDGDFGPKTDAAVRAFQAARELVVDGIVGPATWTAVLKPPVASQSAVTAALDKLEAAGRAAVTAAARLWSLDAYNAQPNDTSNHGVASRKVIDEILKACGWPWEVPYNGRFKYCGLFVGRAWLEAGLDPKWIATYFASTIRLDMWARYRSFDEKHPNDKPAPGPRRLLAELNPASLRIPFAPRAGDILMIGDGDPAAGDHVTLVEAYDAESRTFRTIEGNGGGLGPDGKRRMGIVRAVRSLGGGGYCARRLIRPAPSDLLP